METGIRLWLKLPTLTLMNELAEQCLHTIRGREKNEREKREVRYREQHDYWQERKGGKGGLHMYDMRKGWA